MRTWWSAGFLVALLLLPTPARGQGAVDPAELSKVLVSGKDEDARVRAGLQLALKAPDALEGALDDLVKAKRDGDEALLSRIAVQVKAVQIRLLLAYEANRLGGAVKAFEERIDNDHPEESIRAIEILGYLKDPSVTEKLLQLARGPNELVAIEAARSLAKVATKRDAKALVELAVGVDNPHVRLHVAWALKDALGSTKTAMGMLARLVGKRGTEAFRAKEALGFLEDDETRPESYKVKLDTVRDFFGKRGSRLPAIDGPDDYAAPVKKALEGLQQQAPEWYHLVCHALKKITISGNEQILDFKLSSVNLRLRDLVNWKLNGELRPDLVCYYVIRYAAIIFYEKMGDPGEGHRGWEEGILAAWFYAMDYTKIAVDEDRLTFLKNIINARPPPW